jgi:uncharacterized protein
MIRPMVDADAESVLTLNEESVKALSPMSLADLARHRRRAAHALVAEVDNQVVGFAFAYAPGSPYESLNYRWYSQRFGDFLYLDRIAVDANRRRQGIGAALYDDLEAHATQHGRMVCEVNCDPPNEESLAFHARRGYRTIGRLRQEDGHETVLLEKVL